MRAAAALLLVCGVAAAQAPARPFTVVVVPAAIRDSMSAIWRASNRNWDWVAGPDLPPEMQGAAAPTKRYLGCLTGSVGGDTLWVRHLVPATGLRRGQSKVTGDCSNVPELIGTWRTHPYRAGFEGRPIKERGLSGFEFEAFAATGDLVSIVVWDVDSLELATKQGGGRVRQATPYIVR